MRYLIIKTSAFGDVVQTFPVLHYLKAISPQAEIDWVVEKKIAPLVRAHPDVSRVIEVNAKEWKKTLWNAATWKEAVSFIGDLRQDKYDAVFDLQSNIKSASFTLFTKTHAKVGFGWKTAAERLNCCFISYRSNPPKGQNIRRDYLYVVQNFFKDFSSSPCESVELRLTEQENEIVQQYVKRLPSCAWMVCPGSNWPNKQLPKEKLKAFLESSRRAFNPFYLFLCGTADERKIAQEFHEHFPNSLICDRLSLPVIQHLMAKMELVITMDSLPLHLAATTPAATFSIFGPSVSFKYRPLGEQHFSFQGSCPYGRTFEKRCPILRTCSTGSCIRDVNPETIFTTFSQWWNQVQNKNRLVLL